MTKEKERDNRKEVIRMEIRKERDGEEEEKRRLNKIEKEIGRS